MKVLICKEETLLINCPFKQPCWIKLVLEITYSNTNNKTAVRRKLHSA